MIHFSNAVGRIVHAMLPALNLPLSVEEEEEENKSVDALLALPAWFAPTPIEPARGALVPNNNSVNNIRDLASKILERGSLSVVVLQAGAHLYEVVVDIEGVPRVALNVLKSLVLDSWIVTSNTLAPVAGKLPIADAIVRGMIMLLVKRSLGIKQLGPVKNIFAILNFVRLASEAMSIANYNPSLSSTLSQISAIPIMVYTALARTIVDAQAKIFIERAFLRDNISQSNLKLDEGDKGWLGKNGDNLKNAWKKAMEGNPQLKRYVSAHTPRDLEETKSILSGFSRLLSY